MTNTNSTMTETEITEVIDRKQAFQLKKQLKLKELGIDFDVFQVPNAGSSK